MPQDMSGYPVPVALINDPIFKRIAAAATSGNLKSDGGPDLNTVDLFRASSGVMNNNGGIQSGTAIIILNSLDTPLTLIDSFVHLADNGQKCYPAVIDPKTGSPLSKHVIPGTRPYPRPSKHPKGALMGGIGIYRFEGGAFGHVDRGLSFSCAKDGSATDPIVGVTVVCLPSPNTGILGSKGHVAVTANLSSLSGSTGMDKLATLYGNVSGPGPTDDVDKSTTVTVSGAFVSQPSQFEKTLTITVWVRNAASTLGM